MKTVLFSAMKDGRNSLTCPCLVVAAAVTACSTTAVGSYMLPLLTTLRHTTIAVTAITLSIFMTATAIVPPPFSLPRQ